MKAILTRNNFSILRLWHPDIQDVEQVSVVTWVDWPMASNSQSLSSLYLDVLIPDIFLWRCGRRELATRGLTHIEVLKKQLDIYGRVTRILMNRRTFS